MDTKPIMFQESCLVNRYVLFHIFIWLKMLSKLPSYLEYSIYVNVCEYYTVKINNISKLQILNGQEVQRNNKPDIFSYKSFKK